MKTLTISLCYLLAGLIAFANSLAQDSLNIRKIGQLYDFWTWGSDVQVVGSHAYFAASAAGLIVLDVADPANPMPIGHYDCGDAHALAIRGNYAYIAGSARFDVLNIADPAHPFALGYCPLQNGSSDLAVSGNSAFVAAGGGGLCILDISDPVFPHQVSVYQLTGNTTITCVAVSGNYAYVGELDHSTQPTVEGMRVLNVLNPSQPAPVGFLDNCDPARIAISGHYAYIAYNDFFAWGWTGLVVADIANPAAPIEVGYWDLIDGELTDITVSGNLACVSNQYVSSLHIINISDPSQPTQVGTCYGWNAIALSGNTLYAAGPWLEVFDLSSPANPVQIGELLGWSHLNAVVVSDTLAYITDGRFGLRVVNIANPAVPVEVGQCNIPNYNLDLAVAGHYVYVVDNYTENGLYVVDASNPVSPAVVNHWTEAGHTYDIAISGNFAYIPDGSSLRVLDISNPAAPQQIAQTTELPGVRKVALAGQVACLAPNDYSSTTTTYFVDISDPMHPLPISSYTLPGPHDFVQTMAVSGHRVYVLFEHWISYPDWAQIQLAVLDITVPSAPVEELLTPTSMWGNEMVALDSILVMSSGNGGIRVWNALAPGGPTEIGYYITPGWATSLAVRGTRVFVADEIYLGIYDISEALPVQSHIAATPLAFSLDAPYPNPFNPSTTISFSLPRMCEVNLSVFDVTGRLVRTLSDGILKAGEHRVELNGSSLPSGIYFARLDAGKNIQTQKMVLLK